MKGFHQKESGLYEFWSRAAGLKGDYDTLCCLTTTFTHSCSNLNINAAQFITPNMNNLHFLQTAQNLEQEAHRSALEMSAGDSGLKQNRRENLCINRWEETRWDERDQNQGAPWQPGEETKTFNVSVWGFLLFLCGALKLSSDEKPSSTGPPLTSSPSPSESDSTALGLQTDSTALGPQTSLTRSVWAGHVKVILRWWWGPGRHVNLRVGGAKSQPVDTFSCNAEVYGEK